jgi:Asp-tRNA(Asn)/Glu-tRNA(Gln) amidotransferase B subunit
MEVEQSKIQPLEVEPLIKLVEEEVITANLEVGTKALVTVQVENIETIVEQPKT